MYQIVLFIQFASAIVLLAECWVVFKNWKGLLHSYLFLGCVATLVNNIGYFLQLQARTEEAYLAALHFSYFGRVWISFALFFFIAELVRIRIPTAVKVVLALSNIATYVILYTNGQTGLYYKDTHFTVEGSFPLFTHTNGIWHTLWNCVLLSYIAFGLTMLVIAWKKEKSRMAKKRLLMVFLSILTQSVSLVIGIFKLFPFTLYYDTTMIGFPIGALFILIANFRYRLLDTETLAREYVIDELSEAIIAVNDRGEVSYYNKPALTLFPALKTDTRSVISMLQKAIEAQKPLNLSERIYTPEANTLYQNGAYAGALYALTDDTEHYRYMEKLEEQKQIADDANKAKSSFLANMSHEIRTPINAVLGMDEMILRESGEPQILSYASDIQKAGHTLLSLINDILDFSKIEEGRMEILPTQYELSSLVIDLYNMIHERAEKKGLKLLVSVDSEMPHLLYGDEIRIKQIALNLLTNAVKYTESGEVKLEVSFEKSAESEILLKVKIADTGIGMKEEDMDKLFSPFTRIEEKRNRSVEGTGLGMSIVKQLLSLMDSHLDVTSVYGEGSEFSFEIKQKVIKWDPIGDVMVRPGESNVERKAYHELFHAPAANLLVVDDTEMNLTVIQNLLKKTQIKIDTALSGKEALNAAKNKHYDIVFIDHMMPDMDGVETLHAMRELPDNGEAKGQDTVYIALTANAVSGAREMYLEAGFADYISKPVNGKRLEKMIRNYLPSEKVLAAVDDEVKKVAGLHNDRNRKVLVVDDDEVICETVSTILGKHFSVIAVTDGREAHEKAKKEQPALILLDINLIGMTGFEVLSELKEDRETAEIPVMFITADEDREKEVMGIKNGALDFVRKPFVPEVLVQRSKRIVELDRFQKNLKGEVEKQTGRAERLTKEMMIALSHTVDAKDHYTNGHSARVAAYAAEIARRLGRSAEEQNKIYEIGLLHDIGKIGISEEIINKTEKLTDEEFNMIKQHTVIGYEILKGISDLPELSRGARSHHERYDGKGYPDHLAGDAIPEEARIICVADCYDAMTSTRTYSKPKAQDVVRAEIVKCSGSHFDPQIAQIMLEMIDDDTDFIMNEKTGGKEVWKGNAAFWGDEEEEKETAVKDEEELLPAWLYAVEGLNTDQGIANCGSVESYLSVLNVFHQTAEQKADEIARFYRENDWENYTVKVHALKSSARIIGATELSEMARDLEEAGKERNLEKISRNTDALLDAYRTLDEKLTEPDDGTDIKRELKDSQRKEAFQTITEIARSMDYGMMEHLLQDLKAYRLSDEDAKTVKKIEDLLMQLDWDGIEKEVKAVLS